MAKKDKKEKIKSASNSALLKIKLKSAEEVSDFAECIINTVREPLLVLDKELRIVKASRSFYDFFKVTPVDTIGKLIYDLENHQWDIPKLKELLETILPGKSTFDNYEVEHVFSAIGKRVMLLNARQIERAVGNEKIILLAIEDITERKLIEESLSEKSRLTNEYLNTLLDHTHVPIIIWDASLIIKRFNHEFEKLSGYDSTIVLDKTIDILFPKNKIDSTIELIKNALSDKNPEAVEIDILTKDKNIKTILWSSVNICDEDGINTVATIAHDITKRKHVEEALQESEEKYHSLIESSEDSIYLVDKDCNYLYTNNKYLSRLGMQINQVIGKAYREFHTPEGSKEFELKIKNVFETGKSLSYEYKSPSDNLYFIRTLSPVKVLGTGKPTAVTIISKNITERKRAEEEIISQKIKFAQLFDNSPIAIALLDNKDKIVFINESFSALFGYYPEEIRGKSLDDLIAPHELKEEAQTYSNETRSGNQVNKESYRKKKDGTLVYVQIVGIPVIVNDKTDGIYGMYVNLTQRKKNEEELIKAKEQSEEMNRLKNFFLSNMSHELRTPLISVLGFAELLQQKLNDHEHLEFVNNIIEGGQRLNNTLSGILEISKLEAANSFLNLQQYNLADEIKTRVQSFLPMAQSKRLFLKTELNDTYLNVYIDTELFGKALYQLINNGIKFTKEGGVFVTLNHKRKQGNDWAVTKVIDTGIGIPRKNFEKIFSAFSQLDEGYSKSHEGTGIGLTIAKRIVELMKGYMQVESDVGEGSVFSIWLPAIPNQNQIQQLLEEKQTTTIVKPPTTKEKGLQKVLLVDDNSSNRLFIKHCLSAYVRIIEAEDVISGVTTASKVHFDLILIDINLGAGIDGIQAMHEIRKITGYASVPIIAVTAYAMFRDKERFLNEGFDFYLAKPFTQDALVSLVKKVLAKVKK